MVEVCDGDGGDADRRAELRDGADESGTLGADGESIADIFNVCSGNDFASGEAEGCSDAEAGVGRVGVERSLFGPGEEFRECGIDGGVMRVFEAHLSFPIAAIAG